MTYLEQLTHERRLRHQRFNEAAGKVVSKEEQKKRHDDAAKIAILLERVSFLERQLEAARTIHPQPDPVPIKPVEGDFPAEPAPPYRPSVARVKVVVATHYGVTINDLDGPHRCMKFVRPRQIAIAIACRVTLRSLPFIGRHFGGRDHTTALHARNKIESMRRDDPVFDDELTALEMRLMQP